MGSEPTFPVAGAGGDDPSFYWFYAAEEDALADIDFTEFDPAILDEGYFGEIDRILESISNEQNKQQLPLPPPVLAAPVPVEIASKEERPVENGFRAEEKPAVKESRSLANGEGRYNKKSRNGGDSAESRSYYSYRNDRYSYRDDRYRESNNRYRESSYGRRGSREWEESDRRRREGDRNRKRERDWDRREWRDRDRDRGYWERDASGKLVFRVGSWEADSHRDPKRVKVESLEEGKKSPVKEKERPAEEQARKYQLDVLEQAKQKNTIAFLETGAGKTLIAVLLIKSMYTDMLQQNKKMLAIFLVPKVPLVYQVRKRTVFDIVFSFMWVNFANFR